ncbi:MAG: ATP-binding cassette, subfamily bacterial CvaB/MchF/RaxB [Sphingomonadales bacterium]|nr:ATP-binding cassette, subfamily bacterial CvaB/MchF/RaxB [Sphingomonadales bacterium]
MSITASRRRKISLVRQATYFECGLACLVMIARSFGAKVSLAGVRKMHPPSARGMTLAGMVDVARKLGLDPVPVAIGLDGVAELELPAILHWGFSHFVVLTKLDGRELTIFDPGLGRRRLTLEEAAPLITGVAIEFGAESSPDSFADAVRPLRLLDLLPAKRQIALPLAGGAAISLCLELLLVLSPWIVSRIVNAPMSGPASPLRLGLFSVGVLLALSMTRVVRGAVVVQISGLTQKAIMKASFQRLVANPSSFFENRYSTYVVSRFEGTDRLRTVFSEDYLNASIDVVMLVVLLLAIGALNPGVMILTAAAGLLVGAIRLCSGILSRDLMDEVVHARSLERLHLMETVRSIRALKRFGKTDSRRASYGRRVDNSVACQGNYAWHRALFDAASSFVSECAWVGLTVYLILLPRSVQGSPAAVLTLILYIRMVMDRASLLSGKLAELTTVKVQLEHLADIIEVDGAEESRGRHAPPFESLDISQLAFGYDSSEPVIRNFSLHVSRGEFVAIAGPSGCGKTTILKLISGLLTPTGGALTWSGVQMSECDPRSLQRRLGFVFQDDELLEGDILGNITLFERDPDLDRVWEVCEAAHVADEVRAMPMRLLTMVGERGSALSGGQRQRLLIARALYHQPELLLLDEATSQLDLANEKAIYAELRARGLTVIMVSHRPEAIGAADRIYQVRQSPALEEVRLHA